MSLEDIDNILKTKPAVLLYFSGIGCGVCTVLQPKIKDAFEKNYPLICQYHLDIEQHRDIAIKFQVFSAPTILVFLDGKEFARKGRNLSVDGLIQDLKRPYSLFFN